MKVNLMVKNAFITALMCVFSVIALPVSEVPFSLGIVGAFVCGALLSSKNAVMASVCYILLGAIGVPVFAGFRGGLGVLLGATGGFILSYPFMAFFVSFITNKSRKKYILPISMLGALVICYVAGAGWFSVISGCSLKNALAVCVLPYVFFDLIKIAISVILCNFIKNMTIKNH